MSRYLPSQDWGSFFAGTSGLCWRLLESLPVPSRPWSQASFAVLESVPVWCTGIGHILWGGKDAEEHCCTWGQSCLRCQQSARTTPMALGVMKSCRCRSNFCSWAVALSWLRADFKCSLPLAGYSFCWFLHVPTYAFDFGVSSSDPFFSA
jgi:hypothetical protein